MSPDGLDQIGAVTADVGPLLPIIQLFELTTASGSAYGPQFW